ncbi:MAG: hypothetical protein ABDH25_01550 [Dictyoglomaceae bacterium]
MRTFWGFLVIILDKIVSLFLGVKKFTENPKCILRYRPVKVKKDIVLPNGDIIKKNSWIIDLHLWNEHLPPIPKDGVDLDWGRKFYSLLINSFLELLDFLENSRWKNVEYLFGETAFFFVDQERVIRFLNKLGFLVLPLEEGKTHGEDFYRFLQNGYSWCLIYAYNKESLKRKKDFFYVRRYNLWVKKDVLRKRLKRRIYEKMKV